MAPAAVRMRDGGATPASESASSRNVASNQARYRLPGMPRNPPSRSSQRLSSTSATATSSGRSNLRIETRRPHGSV